MNYKILITGGAGYLGSVLTPELLKQGHKVTVLDSFMYGQNSLAECCRQKNFNVVRGDCRDKATIARLAADKDIIIPLAALVGAPLCDRDQIGAVTINRDAIETLSETISNAQRIVIPITNSGYGVGEKGKFCTEQTPMRPISLYGKVKVEAEEIALQRENTVSLRLATVFGMSSRMRLDLLVNDFVYRAVTD
ncbi:MAG: NAD-dependent epimerase/dehydratase, partial [Victivallaceae bacterium]